MGSDSQLHLPSISHWSSLSQSKQGWELISLSLWWETGSRQGTVLLSFCLPLRVRKKCSDALESTLQLYNTVPKQNIPMGFMSQRLLLEVNEIRGEGLE